MPSPLSPVATRGFAAAVEEKLARNGSLLSLCLVAQWLRANPLLLVSALSNLIRDPLALHAVAARSYWHCNGFAKIVLHRTETCVVRLHVWPKAGSRFGDINPHGHRWEFASWVIAGSLQEITFTECSTEQGRTYDRCEYGRNANGTGYIRFAGRVALREVERNLRRPDTVYECPKTVLHTVEPLGSELIATVVIQGPAISESTPIYLVPDSLSDGDQLALSIEELQGLLQDVSEAIS